MAYVVYFLLDVLGHMTLLYINASIITFVLNGI